LSKYLEEKIFIEIKEMFESKNLTKFIETKTIAPYEIECCARYKI